MDATASLFRIGLANVRSLVPKIEEVRCVIEKLEFDLFVVVESWISDSVLVSAIDIPGYNVLLKNRSTNNHGGIALYYKKELNIKELITNTCTEGIETLTFMLHFNSKRFGICSVYRPPNVLYSNLTTLEQLIAEIYPRVDNVILLGDVNCDFLTPSKPETVYLQSVFDSFGITQMVTKPTRVTKNSQTLLDVIAVDDKTIIHTTDVTVPIGTSDHCVAFADLIYQKPKYKERTVTFRDFSKFNLHYFEKDIQNIDWPSIQVLHNIDDKVDFLSANLIRLYDKHAPFKTVIQKKNRAPWVSSNTRLLMRLRDNAFRKFKRTNCLHDWTYYKELRNFTTSVIRQEKKAYFSFKFNGRYLNTKQSWNDLREHGIIKGSNIDGSGVFIKSVDDLNALNQHFGNVCNQGAISLPIRQQINHYERTTFSNSKFDFSQVTETEVRKALYSIRSNSSGSDGITSKMLKSALPYIIHSLTHIINFSLSTGTFPSSWKDARVLPLPKKQKITSFNDLRPISLLPVMSKILEKVVYRQVIKFTESNSMLPPVQSGFRSMHSTGTALTKVMNDFYHTIDKRNVAVLVLLDLSKAFDTVNHELLLAKLKYYNFSSIAIKWFCSYLFNRRQRTVLPATDNCVSHVLELKAGVPQGSILGPYLFTLYTSDIYEVVKCFTAHFYADDTQLYFSTKFSDLTSKLNALNKELQNIHEWCVSHGLKINPAKSAHMIITSKGMHKLVQDFNLDLRIGNSPIPRVNSAKNLGIIVNQTLSWDEHILTQCHKSYGLLRNLYRFGHGLEIQCKLKLVQLIIWPLFDYCDYVYGTNLSAHLNRKVQLVQNATIRYIFGLRRWQHILPYLNQHNILTMNNRRLLHYLSFIRNILINGRPEYLLTLLRNRNNIHLHNTRSSGRFDIPRHSSTVCEAAFSISASRAWNALPDTIKTIANPIKFKSQIIALILERQQENLNTMQRNYLF